MTDLISRQEMLNRLEEWNTDDPTDKALYNFAWNRIIEQPTIEPERKKGKWIDDNCYECGFYVHHGDMRNFCPNCGAKMIGGNQNE